MTSPSQNNKLVIPAPIRHANAVWRLMLENAETEKVAIPMTDDVVECLVFRGRIGDVFKAANVSNTYYTPVRKILVDFGSITILERGTVHNPSLVILDPDRPPPTTAEELIVKSDPEDLTTDELLAMLLRRVEVLETRLGGINIVEAFRNVETRLSNVESQTGDRRE